MKRSIICLASALLLGSCQPGEDTATGAPAQAFDGIAVEETIYLTGTEPFWGGEISGSKAEYSTPEYQDGVTFDVERFSGNNGLAFTGQIDGGNFDLMVTPANCSDGMSDRSYPFTATLKVGDEQRNGCAWTNRQPFTGPESP